MEREEYIKRYVDNDYHAVVVKSKSKEPLLSGWLASPAILATLLEDDTLNVGVALGSRSGGLVDIDHDCHEAIRLAASVLPLTGMIFGRDSKPRSHWLYRVSDDPGRSKRFSSGGGMLVEYRADGAQTVFPPSVHPSGEAIRFDEFGEPAVVERDELLSAVRLLASASIIVRHGNPGDLNEISGAVSRLLREHGYKKEQVDSVIAAICEVMGDE